MIAMAELKPFPVLHWGSADGTRTAGVPRHKEIKTPTARSICRDLGIPIPPYK